MEFEIQIEKFALKQLSKLEKGIRKKIIAKIDSLVFDPRPYGYKKLVDSGKTCRVKDFISASVEMWIET